MSPSYESTPRSYQHKQVTNKVYSGTWAEKKIAVTHRGAIKFLKRCKAT